MSENDADVETAEEPTTTDHAIIRSWVDRHDGYPAHLRRSEGGGDEGLLRVGFADANFEREGDLKELSWEEFFAEFDEKDLVFVYPETDPREQDYPPSLLRERDGA